MEINVNNENYKQEVEQSSLPVLVDLWAPWCGPCRMLGPVIAEIAAEYKEQIKVCKINVDDAPELARAFNAMSIPMLVYIREGKVIRSKVGYHPKEDSLSFSELT